ncbi:hypothetical protein [Nocardia asiatica]|uniref:hypothetical protein n=1 Tax=Nocardia asiatica TaxID=209252 RepID=UPI002457B140|nr:hypothetical protein [Nocardia asiatica]
MSINLRDGDQERQAHPEGVLRDYVGHYVIAASESGVPVDTGVSAEISVHGSFRVRYAAHVDRVCVRVYPASSSAYVGMSMQLTLEQATALRALLDAGIADAVAARDSRGADTGEAVDRNSAKRNEADR